MNGHPTHEEDFDLYALGALEGEEKLALESHLTGCAACTRKLAEARGRMSLLSAAAEQIAPPAAARARLMKLIREDAVSAKSPVRAEAEPRSAFGRLWIAILAPAAVALAVVTFMLWNENNNLNRQLQAQQDAVKSIQAKLQATQKEIEFITSPDTMTVALKETPGKPAGAGKARYNPRMGMVEFDSAALPMPAADKSYQLWLVPKAGAPISAGVFRPDANGKSSVSTASIQPGTVPAAFAVTVEPLGGLPQPTLSTMVLLGPAI